MSDITWRNDTRRIGDLVRWENNPKRMTKKQADGLRVSLETFGYAVPFLVSPDGDILDGHQRDTLMRAMKEYGPNAVIDVRVSSRPLTDDERRELVVRLKQNQAGWDFDMLPNLYDKEELLEWGFEPEELGMFPADDVADDPGAQVDKAAELQAKWGTATGQLWLLDSGNGYPHRLICGDCTDAAVVAMVMGGEEARLVFTSPPYADQREYTIGQFDWLALANGMFDALPLGDPCDVVVNLGLSYKDGKVNQYWQPWLEHCEAKGLPLYGWYVWDKGSGFPGEWNGRLAPAHEWIFHFSKGRQSAQKWIETTGESAKRGASGKRFRQKDGSLQELTSPSKIGQPFKIPDSVIRVGREMARGVHTQSHPAVFPPELAEFAAQTWSDAGAIVYDPFLGSGTTLIACERLGRRCRAVEIEPSYVGVALERFYQMTGIEPVLLTS